MRMLEQPRLRSYPHYVFYKDVFSKGECETIVHYAKNIPPESAKVSGDVLDLKIRSAEIRWVDKGDKADWIFNRLAGICQDIRLNWYPFQLAGFGEPIQITRYLATEGGHYEAHMDLGGDGMSNRKLSLVALLSDPADFQGGGLEMLAEPTEDKSVKELTQGAVIAFPSWELHRVRPLTQGERWSLVCWVSGPPFS